MIMFQKSDGNTAQYKAAPGFRCGQFTILAWMDFSDRRYPHTARLDILMVLSGTGARLNSPDVAALVPLPIAKAVLVCLE